MILKQVDSRSKAWLNAVGRSTPSSDESFPNAITFRRDQIPADPSFHWVRRSVFGGQAVWAWMWAWLSCSEIYECMGHYYNTHFKLCVLIKGEALLYKIENLSCEGKLRNWRGSWLPRSGVTNYWATDVSLERQSFDDWNEIIYDTRLAKGVIIIPITKSSFFET
jgi:hypothetical protein